LSAISAGPDGALWFTNGGDSIGRITTAGVITNHSDPTISDPDGITTGPDGALWFTNSGNNSIGRITTAGAVSNYTSPSISSPDGITTGPDGALWFTNYGNASIGRITTGDGSASQAISFTSVPPSNAMVGGPGYAVSATGGGSGNPVTLSVDPSAAAVCSLSGSVVAFVGAGTCIIDANQAGSAEYSAAPLAQQRFSVHPEPPAITSVDGATATVGVPFSFTVTTTGNPAPAITERGTLPRHLRFASLHNGTATVSGTPARAGVYDLTIRAVAGRGKTKSVVTQPFTLTVNPA
jgi:hypothetical protein